MLLRFRLILQLEVNLTNVEYRFGLLGIFVSLVVNLGQLFEIFDGPLLLSRPDEKPYHVEKCRCGQLGLSLCALSLLLGLDRALVGKLTLILGRSLSCQSTRGGGFRNLFLFIGLLSLLLRLLALLFGNQTLIL